MTPNIDQRGQRFRAIGGLMLVAFSGFFTGAVPAPWPPSAFVIMFSLLFAGGFMLFEAVQGWCALRACGIRTPF